MRQTFHHIQALTLGIAWLTAPAFAEDTPAPIRLMFGAATKHKALMQFMDFAYVTTEDAFSADKPWGWTEEGAPPLSKAEQQQQRKPIEGWIFDNQRRATRPLDGLLEHTMVCRSARFVVRVPNGPVAVHVWTGHMGDYTRQSFRIHAEGEKVVEERITFKTVCSERYWLRGESEVYRTKADRWARQAKPVLDEFDFTVTVEDGTLDLLLDHVNLCAMVVLPGADETRMQAMLSSVEHERRKQFDERHPWQAQADDPMPAIRPVDRQRGFIFFEKSVDDDVMPWSRPAEHEVTDTVRAFCAQGEQEAFRFGILPLKPLKAFSVAVGDFTGSDGVSIRTSRHADLWTERYTERGTQKGRPDLDPICEVLLERGPTDYEPGLPRMFTLDLRTPGDAAPGFHTAPIVFRSGDSEIGRAKLLLRVLPWQLEFARVPYSFQATYIQWHDFVAEELDTAAVKRTRADRVSFIGKYGFQASYFAPTWGWGTIRGEPGSRHWTQSDQEAQDMDWWYQLVMNEGNAKDYWIQLHWPGYFWSRGRWAAPFAQVSGRKHTKEEATEADRADLIQCIRDFEEICRRKGYPKHYWYGSGEPDNFGLAGVQRGNEFAEIVHAAGGSTLCALNGPWGNKLAPEHHDIVLANHATPISDEFIARVRELGHRFGSHNTGMSRMAAGYQLWRMGACAKFQEVILYVAYTYPYTYLPWNYKAAYAYPKTDGGWRPTIRWLRYRDGRDDFMYMHNLEQRVAKANEAGLDASPAVKEAVEFLQKMRETIHVDPKAYFRGVVDAKETGSSVAVGWSSVRFARYRWYIATLVMDIDAAITQAAP